MWMSRLTSFGSAISLSFGVYFPSDLRHASILRIYSRKKEDKEGWEAQVGVGCQ
jgi:hypothetical protein